MNIDQLQELIQLMIRENLRNAHVCLPCIVNKYYIDRQEVDVTIISGDQNLDISRVPLVYPSSNDGVTFIHIPIKEGDTGILVFNDVDMIQFSAYVDEYISLEDISLDNRLHDLADCYFILGAHPTSKTLDLTEADANDIIIKDDQSEIRLSNDGKFKIKNESEDVLLLFKETINTIKALTVVTVGGPAPLSADSIAKLEAIVTRLDTLIY
jgi:hypothetical protein